MNWRIRGDIHVNTGVLYFSGTERATYAGNRWHEKWKEWYACMKDHRDQLAFNNVIAETGTEFQILQHRFNAQFKTAPGVAIGATIWHYYAAMDAPPMTEFDLLVRHVLSGGELVHADVHKMLQHFHPWRRDFFFDDWAAKWVARKAGLSVCPRTI